MLRLANYWYIAASSSELRSRPIRRLVEGVVLALFRDAEGKPRAVEDRCLHRGMALSAGKAVGGCIRCPYHGWEYDGDGSLCSVPALCKGEKLPQAKVRAYPVIEQDDQLWVWIGSDSPSQAPFHFPKYGAKGWASFFMRTGFSAPVEDCLENFLDVPHTIFVHPGLFRGNVQRPTRARIRRTHDSVEVEFIDEGPLQGFGPRLLFSRGAVRKHTDRFILPSISRVDYTFHGESGEESGFVITSQCTQREEYSVDVVTAITWKLPVPVWIVKPFLKWYCRRVIQQDVDILEVQGEQLKTFGKTSMHSEADLLGRHISQLRRRAAEGLEGESDLVEETMLNI